MTGGGLVVNALAFALVVAVLATVIEANDEGPSFLLFLLGALLGAFAALGANGAL